MSTNRKLSRKPRYLVNPLSGMKVKISQSHGRNHALATIGDGGFGIYCSHKESRLIRLNTIDIEMAVGDCQIKAQGKIQYFKCLPEIRPDLYFVGIALQANHDTSVEWKKLVEEARYKGYLAKPIH